MDNLPAHKVIGLREAIEAVGATVIYLSPYSPDFSPLIKLLVKSQRVSSFTGGTNLRTGGIFLDELFIQKMPFRPSYYSCSRCGDTPRHYWLVYPLLLLYFTQLRTAVIGDTKQLSSVESGCPFRLLQRAGIETAYMTEGRRQKEPEPKAVIDLAAAGKIAESYQRPKQSGRIALIADRQERTAIIASDYLSRTPKVRSHLVLTGTNQERDELTGAIRAGLLADGILSQKSITVQTLKNKNLDSWSKKQAVYYGLCCKNFVRTEQSLQSTLVIQQLQKYETRILLALKCHLFLLVEFVLFVPYS